MERGALFYSVVAGVAAAGLYIAVYAFGLGIALLLLPTLPLFMLGLREGFSALTAALCIATLCVLLISGGKSALFFLGFLGIPVLLFAPAALMQEETAEGKVWRPVGALLMDISIYAALIFAALILHYAPEGGLKPLFATQLTQQFADAEPDVQATVTLISEHFLFIILAASAWWWVFLVWAHATVATMLLDAQKRALRPSLALRPFSMPGWVLGLLTLCAFLSLSGHPDWALLGRSCFLIVLLPYFLLGLTWIHRRLPPTPLRQVTLFMLYFFTASLVWPALVIAGVGVWQQCRELRSAGLAG